MKRIPTLCGAAPQPAFDVGFASPLQRDHCIVEMLLQNGHGSLSVVVTDQISDLPVLAAESRALSRLIAILIPLAALGVLGLAAVVLVHEIAEIFVIGNGVAMRSN